MNNKKILKFKKKKSSVRENIVDVFLWNHDSTKRIYKRKITKKLLENLKNQEKDVSSNVTRPRLVKTRTLNDEELFNLFLSWKQIDENLVRKSKRKSIQK